MIIDPSKIFINNYDYFLPEHKIAEYPLQERDNSKLLIFNNGNIIEDKFNKISDYLKEDTLLIFNDTKVIPARLIFQKETGAEIEILCLEQYGDDNKKGKCQWKCLVGNLKKWKSGKLIKSIKHEDKTIILEADRNKIQDSDDLNSEEDRILITFNWQPDNLDFSDVLEIAGLVPLPPYIKRNAEKEDKTNYQTVYAKNDGSIAAPTAGLHFTQNVLQKLKDKNIKSEYLTLHVNTGTFKPVTSSTIADHKMHREYISVNIETINNIIKHKDKPIVSVGTTSVRVLESLYWFGVKLLYTNNYQLSNKFEIEQWEPYKISSKYKVKSIKLKINKGLYSDKIEPVEAYTAIKEYMEINHLKTLTGGTSLMIVPGYKFKVINGLITNFHQPKSTLLLLIAAFIGETWKEIYEYALKNDFRFLSYGDCCFFQSNLTNNQT